MNRLVWMGFFSFFITGVTLVMLGAVLPELLHHYGRSYQDGGIIVFAQFMGMLAGVLAMPFLTRRLGRRNCFVFALILLGLAEISLFLLPPWPLIVMIAGAAGASVGLVEPGISSLILLAVKEKQAIVMSKLEVAFGLGALVMPFLASFLIAMGAWKYSFLFLFLDAIVMALLWSRLSVGETDALLTKENALQAGGTQQSSYAKKHIPYVLLFAGFFFLYSGSEVSVVHFVPSIFMENWNVSSSDAALTVTLYWFAMTLGRFFSGVIAEKMNYYRYLRVSLLGCLVSLVLLSLTGFAWSGYVLLFLLGLFMSGLFAVALIHANNRFPGMTERTTSILVASAGLGGSLIPLIAGWSMDELSVQATLWFFVSVMLAMLVLMLLTQQRVKTANDIPQSNAASF